MSRTASLAYKIAFVAVALLSIDALHLCSAYHMADPSDDVLYITAPGQLQLFKDGFIGQNAKVVHISSTAAPDILHQAKHFFNRTNDLIQFADGNNTMNIRPKQHWVQATFLNGTRTAQYLPTFYKHYNLTFGRDGTSNDANWRDIFTFHNAETLIVGKWFDARNGYQRHIVGMQRLQHLREWTVDVRPMYSTIQLTGFLIIPPAVQRVRISLPFDPMNEGTDELAANQCLPPLWQITSTADAVIQFDKTETAEYRECWERFNIYA